MRSCWRNPPYPSFDKGGDPKAPFGKGGRAQRGGIWQRGGRKETFASSIAMLALLLPQAALEAKRGQSMALPSQSGSTAPALHIRGARILNMCRIF